MLATTLIAAEPELEIELAPKVSVLVPAFDDEKFLSVSLDSLLAQTVTDFEVVVSNDGGSERTADVVQSYADRDPRVRRLAAKANIGTTANWNRALHAARGSFVMKLDADDAFRPATLATLIEALEGDGTPFAAYCRTLDCDADLIPFSSYLGDNAWIRANLNPLEARTLRGRDWYELCFDDVQLWHSNAGMYRRTDLLALGGWDEAWGCASDTDLILRVLELDRPVAHCPYAGVLYHHRERSVSHQFRKQPWLRVVAPLAHASSLARVASEARQLSPKLRRAWRRRCDALQEVVTALNRLPDAARDRLTPRWTFSAVTPRITKALCRGRDRALNPLRRGVATRQYLGAFL